jgi:hypothetical protein
MRLLDREVTTVSIISGWELELLLLSTKSIESFTRTEAVIGTPLVTEFLESWRIGIEALWLDIWAIFATMPYTLIGRETEYIMSIEYGIDRSLDESSTISIFYTYYI